MDNDVITFAQVMIVVMTSLAALVVIVLGARVLWRLGSRFKPSNTMEASRDRDDRLHHLETAVDSIAIEVERISEAQRFMVGLLGDPARVNRADASLPSRSTGGRTNTPH
jgi:hypothetical protein